MASCPFCEVPPERVVASNALAVALWDAFPAVPLHALVVPRRHAEDYFSLTGEEVLACHELVHRVRELVLAQDAEVGGFNLGVNVGAVAGQTVFHCHVHVIPRRSGDVDRPRGGVRHVIPGRGAY